MAILTIIIVMICVILSSKNSFLLQAEDGFFLNIAKQPITSDDAAYFYLGLHNEEWKVLSSVVENYPYCMNGRFLSSKSFSL